MMGLNKHIAAEFLKLGEARQSRILNFLHTKARSFKPKDVIPQNMRATLWQESLLRDIDEISDSLCLFLCKAAFMKLGRRLITKPNMGSKDKCSQFIQLRSHTKGRGTRRFV